MVSQVYQKSRLSCEYLNEISRAYWNSAVLRAAIQLGIFPLLAERELSGEQVSRHLRSNLRFTEACLRACAVLGLLDETPDGKFHTTPLTKKYLVPGEKEYAGNLIKHITNNWATFGRLDALIREGKTVLPFESGFIDAQTYWQDYMLGQHSRAITGQAEQLVKNVNLQGKRKLLDLGGGQGSYSIALAKAYPELITVVIDYKQPLEIARELIAQHHLQDRVLLREADITEMELDRDADVILISGVVLIIGDDACCCLLRRCYQALLPGGIIIVQDFLNADKSPERRFLDTMMDLYVLTCFSPEAADREGETIAGWMVEAGFSDPVLKALPTQLALVIATKK